MEICKRRFLGISVAIAHDFFPRSCDACERWTWPPYSLQLAKVFAGVTILSTLQSSLTLWSLRGLSLPMYVIFKRCLPLATLIIGVCFAVLITTVGAALAGAGDLTGDPVGYVTGILAVIIHATYLVIIQKASTDNDYGPLTAQYAIAFTASPFLIICSFASMDSINVWSYPQWSSPFVSCTFIACILFGCAMNFTTLHCTYINSAVTTSFVGVVKSIATITVGMLAFNDVKPTALFIAGVVVNTVGSIIYCIVKYFETKKKSKYQDLEEDAKKDDLPGEPYKMDNGNDGELTEMTSNGTLHESSNTNGYVHTPAMNGTVGTMEVQTQESETGGDGRKSVSDAYIGVWRSIRNFKFMKKDPLIENEVLPSP
uniref:Solute carrier family 35 member D3 n=1 Tax=Erpetoichthys calabaricus TaxID=27687 RepID=A0A8C4RMU5_ERPCA